MFIGFGVFGQKKFDIETIKSETTLEGKELTGYLSAFDFDRESVRKGWWKYSRDFGLPLNMKEYYKVTIPANITDGNVDLVIYSQTEVVQDGVNFFLGLEDDKYDKQAYNLLVDFKKSFYISRLIQKIADKEVQAKKLGNAYNDAFLDSERKNILDNLLRVKSEIEELKEDIRVIERQ